MPQCDHDWKETPIRDENFGIIFGNSRKCKKCGKHEVASSCEGRVGGPWREVKKKKAKK